LRGVIEFFRDLLDTPISLGTVHNIAREAVKEAQKINAAQDLSRVWVGAHDALFQAALPVLAGIDLDSTYCYLLTPEAHRDAETWGIHFLELAVQGLHPDYAVADGGRGLRAGQALAWPTVPCYGDVFHALHELSTLATQLEKRAYARIDKRQQVERDMQKAKSHGDGRSLSKRLARVRVQEARCIALADDVRTLLQWMQHDILTLNGLRIGILKHIFLGVNPSRRSRWQPSTRRGQPGR
jgi:hypothetical protein